MGQAFFSVSVVAGVMIAYGSYLKSDSNIVSDSLIIAFSDLFVSILSGIVLFTTMYQAGYTTEKMSASGVATAFIIYPSAIASLTNVPVVNAIFGSAIGFANNLYYSKRWKI